MASTGAPNGALLTTTLATVYTNTSGNERQTVTIDIVNVTAGGVAADVNVLRWRDASNANAARFILPRNYTVEAEDGVSRVKVLDPGDSIEAQASADNALEMTLDVIYAEPVA